jgi:hypothetical protein
MMGHSDLLLVSGSPPPPAAWAPPLVQFYPFPTQAAGQARRPDQCVMYLLLSVPTSAAGSIRRHACVPRSPFSPACLLVFSLSLISKPCGRCGAHGNRRNLDIHFASPIPSLLLLRRLLHVHWDLGWDQSQEQPSSARSSCSCMVLALLGEG